MTSNRASVHHQPVSRSIARIYSCEGFLPAVSLRLSTAPKASPAPVVVLGVALICMPRHCQQTNWAGLWLRNTRAVRSSGEGPVIAPVVSSSREPVQRASRFCAGELGSFRLDAKIPAILASNLLRQRTALCSCGLSRLLQAARARCRANRSAIFSWAQCRSFTRLRKRHVHAGSLPSSPSSPLHEPTRPSRAPDVSNQPLRFPPSQPSSAQPRETARQISIN